MRRKKGFVKFIRKIEGKTTPTKPKKHYKLPDNYDFDTILTLVQEEDITYLNDAFVWSTSEQGHYYWSYLYDFDRDLTQKDLDIFNSWREQLENSSF